MAGQIDPRKLLGSADGSGAAVPDRFTATARLMGALWIELCLTALLYGLYAETLGFASDLYLSELPFAGPVFAAIDEEASVGHLLALLLAIFSVAVPVMIWSVVVNEKVHLDHQRWLASPLNRVRAISALGLYAAVFALEVVNLYTMIAQQTVANPFGTATDLDAVTAFISQNKALGIFVSVLIALVNFVVGLLTVLTANGFHRARKGS